MNKNSKKPSGKSPIPGDPNFEWPMEPGKLLEFIAKRTNSLVFLLDEENRLLMCNENVREFIGDPHSLLGKRIGDYLPEDVYREMEKSFETARNSDSVIEMEHTFSFRGKPVWLSSRVTAIPAPNDDGKWIFAQSHDVSAQAWERINLREAQERLDFISEHASDAIMLLDSDGRVIWINKASERISGYSVEEFLNNRVPWEEVLYPEDAAGLKSLHEEMRSKPQTLIVEFSLRRKDGKRIKLEQKNRPVLNNEGKLTGIVAVARDITERDNMQEALIRSQKITALGTLAGGIAHEFNNLLAIILSNASFIMKEGELDQQSREDVQSIIDAASRAGSITRQLVTYAGGQVARTERGNLNDIVKSLFTIVRDEFATVGINLEENLEPNLPESSINKNLIQQALLHLLTNAKHAAMEADSKTIEVKTSSKNNRIFLQVRDTGVGIPHEDVGRIFDPFHTTKGPLGGSTTPGTGLGLSVSLAIVQQHGGEITVESALGSGSVFTVWLPIATEEKEEKPPPSVKPRKVTEVKTARILVVDDEEVICDLIGKFLGTLGYSADKKYMAREAIETLEEKDYNLVLLDLQMPDMPGEEVIEYIAGMPEARRPSCIVMTGKVNVDKDAMMNRGVFDVLEKPFSLDLLAERAQEALMGRDDNSAS